MLEIRGGCTYDPALQDKVVESRMLEATVEAAPQFFLQTFMLIFFLVGSGGTSVAQRYGQPLRQFLSVTCRCQRRTFQIVEDLLLFFLKKSSVFFSVPILCVQLLLSFLSFMKIALNLHASAVTKAGLVKQLNFK